MSHWSDELVRLGACKEAVAWAKEYPFAKPAYMACQNGQWMSWLLAKVGFRWPLEDVKNRKELIEEATDLEKDAMGLTSLAESARLIRKYIPWSLFNKSAKFEDPDK